MTNRLSEIMESNAVERLATGFVFTEGPLSHREGYCCLLTSAGA